MQSTEIVDIELTSPGGPPPVVHAVAGDIYSRFVEMHLFAAGVPFEPPSGTTCTIGWRRQNGDSGAYSSILQEDGQTTRDAYTLEGSVLTIELDWHVCQRAGDVAVNVSLNGEGGSRLHTWELICRVGRGAVADADDPTKPSESATDAANRAEQAAQDAAASAGQAAASAGKVDAALEELDGMLVNGPVVSVNGKTGRVTLTASDVDYVPGSLPITADNVQDALTFLAGSYFPKLAVTVPAGSLVTVQMDSYSYQQTATEGTASFVLPALGQWTVQASLNEQTATRTVDVDNLGQTFQLTVSYFTATLNVTAPTGATVTATSGLNQVTGTVQSGTTVALTIPVAGTYSVVAAFDGANSQAASVEVTEDGQTYSAEPAFCTLTVTVPTGSQVQAKNGSTTITKTSNGTALFYLPNTGTWQVSASLSGQQASDSIECSAYQGYQLTLSYISISETLNENDWETIHEVSAAGDAASWWAVGDTKAVVLNGKIGILQANVMAIDVFILGFNHNASREGQHLIHFAIGKISGKQVALCDSQYNDYTSSTCFHMNSSDDNGGGWNQSYMRKTILGNSGSPSSPPSNSLLAALPADLRAVMQSVNKYTDNTGHSSNSSGAVTATVDWLWLLAEFELYGSRTYANQYERNSQQQYDYFKAGNPKTFGKHNATGTVVWAWSRSPYYDNNLSFVVFGTDGTAGTGNAYVSGAVCAGFAV